MKIIPFSIDQFSDRVFTSLGIKIGHPSPYKLCDFRPAFGIIFSDIIGDSRYWGHCDIDVFFGNLSRFLNTPISRGAEKILKRGHLTLYQNTPSVNNAFREATAKVDWQTIFTSVDHYIFDESNGIHRLMKGLGFDIFDEEIIADINPDELRFETTNHRNHKQQLFAYTDQAVFRYFIHEKENTTEREEYAYIHFQKRKLPLHTGVELARSFAITPTGFHPLPSSSISPKLLKCLSEPSLAQKIEATRFYQTIRRAPSRIKKRIWAAIK